MCKGCEARDAYGSLGTFFDAPALPDADLARACNEEGWILGCAVAP